MLCICFQSAYMLTGSPEDFYFIMFKKETKWTKNAIQKKEKKTH